MVHIVYNKSVTKAKEFLRNLEEDFTDAVKDYYSSLKTEPKEFQLSRYVKKEAAKGRYYGALEMYKQIFGR